MSATNGDCFRSILSTCSPCVPRHLTPKPTPNLELSPLTRPPSPSTACTGKQSQARCNRRGSCHHNLNDPSLFVPPQQSSLSLLSCDTLNTFHSPIRQTLTKNSCCKSTSTATSLVTGQRLYQRYPTGALFAVKSDPSFQTRSTRSRWSRPVRHHTNHKQRRDSSLFGLTCIIENSCRWCLWRYWTGKEPAERRI